MRDAESQAAFIVCPMCDEKICVGRYVCKQISEYLRMGNNEIMVRMRFMLNEILRLTGDNFGKTVFLTSEEAEAALAKMG